MTNKNGQWNESKKNEWTIDSTGERMNGKINKIR